MNNSVLLLKYLECKTNIFSKIDKVIEKARPPSLDDRKHMPYIIEFLMEVHRYTSDVPNVISHICTRDDMFEGYHIKKAQS